MDKNLSSALRKTNTASREKGVIRRLKPVLTNIAFTTNKAVVFTSQPGQLHANHTSAG